MHFCIRGYRFSKYAKKRQILPIRPIHILYFVSEMALRARQHGRHQTLKVNTYIANHSFWCKRRRGRVPLFPSFPVCTHTRNGSMPDGMGLHSQGPTCWMTDTWNIQLKKLKRDRSQINNLYITLPLASDLGKVHSDIPVTMFRVVWISNYCCSLTCWNDEE